MGNGSTVRRRQLARILRQLREEAGLTIEVAAPALDWSPAKLSRMENARQSIDVHSVRSMLDYYGVGGEMWTELIQMAREARRPGWWRTYGLDDKGYLPLEAEATLVRDFTVAHIPGLLQTEDYARALFISSLVPRTPEALSRDIAVRMIRQQRLTSEEEPLEVVAVVEEGALHRPVGGPAVMRAQLARVIEAAALDSVTFQVLPTGVGAHPAIEGAFTLLSFDGLGEPDMAYVAHPMGAVHLEKADDVARARLVFDHLRSAALGPAESLALVEEVAAQL